mmetsp:Transcript_3769/g.11007  ORF Transcript_3769/g.11007 Transcript_3769/m.11007 type:complete len:229 (-) Transcript_3769:49-735(-)
MPCRQSATLGLRGTWDQQRGRRRSAPRSHCWWDYHWTYSSIVVWEWSLCSLGLTGPSGPSAASRAPSTSSPCPGCPGTWATRPRTSPSSWASWRPPRRPTSSGSPATLCTSAGAAALPWPWYCWAPGSSARRQGRQRPLSTPPLSSRRAVTAAAAAMAGCETSWTTDRHERPRRGDHGRAGDTDCEHDQHRSRASTVSSEPYPGRGVVAAMQNTRPLFGRGMSRGMRT